LNGNKDLNLDLTLAEAELMFAANDKIKNMAQSGELQQLHARCAELEGAVETGFLKVTDHLERVLAQLTQTEEEIY